MYVTTVRPHPRRHHPIAYTYKRHTNIQTDEERRWIDLDRCAWNQLEGQEEDDTSPEVASVGGGLQTHTDTHVIL